jgi:YbbR domain-containing protein
MVDKLKSIYAGMADGDHLAAFLEPMSRNWVLKLFCLALAFAVWQGIRKNTSYEVVVQDVPVAITAGEGLAVLDQSTDVVSIRFRGSRDDIRFVSRDQMTVEVDIPEGSSRLRQTIKFSSHHVKAASRAHTVLFQPPEITVTIDREVERVLPVKAILEGQLPEGIQLEQTVCNPASVRVRGAERRLINMEQVRTVPIRLDGRYNSFKTRVNIASDSQAWVAVPDRVSVDLLLAEHLTSRRVEQSQVRPLLASDDKRVVNISPERVDVVLKGTPQRIERLDVRDIYTYVDCTELTEPAKYEVPVRADLPHGVQVEKMEPSVVTVTVKTL